MLWLRKPTVEIAIPHAMIFAPRAQGVTHHLGRRGCCVRQPRDAQRTQADIGHQEVKDNDAGDTDEEPARQVPP